MKKLPQNLFHIFSVQKFSAYKERKILLLAFFATAVIRREYFIILNFLSETFFCFRKQFSIFGYFFDVKDCVVASGGGELCKADYGKFVQT